MKNKEKRLLLVILLIIVMIIIIITLIRVSKNDDNGILINGENVFLDGSKEGQKISINAQKQLSNIITKNEYYNLTYCVNAYQSIINDVVSSSTEENNTKILSILDNEYIQEKNITMTNIKNVYNGYRQSEIYLDEIMSIQLSNNVKAYLIKGKSVNNNIKSNSYLIIKLDNANHTYSVYPYDYVMEKSYNLLKAGDILNIEDCTSIEKKQYNEFTDQTYEYESIAYLYYDKIKADELYDAETIYNMLDQEYQNKRFGSLNNFKSYINLNKEKISNGTLTKYSREYGDGFVKYICTDSNNNVYTIKETSTLNYTVQLDDYTIETDEFKTKYEQSSNQVKVVTNIDKFMKMLNSCDYQTAYNLLDDTYKTNNFPTLNSYVTYVKNNFWSIYTIDNISEQGNYFVVTLTTKQRASASSAIKTNQIIMALNQGTDFKMSFAK